MRVALLTDGIFPYVIGGMQKHSYYLAKYLCRSGTYVTLYHTNQSKFNIQELELFTQDEKKFLTSVVVPFPKGDGLPGHYLRSSYTYSIKVYEAFSRQPAPDMVYAKGFSGWYLLEQKKKKKVNLPVAVNFHGYEMFQPPPNFKARVEQWLLLRKPVQYITNQADLVFSYGSHITRVVKSIPVAAEKIIEIPTGIESEWINDNFTLPGEIRNFVFVGRFERRKGIYELHEAIKQLGNLPFRFQFIGPVPEQHQLHSPQVTYHGSISDADKIKSILRSCDVLVCPSYSEGMPNVIMEGMASGLAVIATDTGAVNLLVDEHNGLLLPVTELDKLSLALKELISIPAEKLSGMKKYSVQKIKENFLWDKIAAMHLDIFRKLTMK